MAARPRPRFPFLDWPGPIPFAHKGGAADNPENTMAAFEHAVRVGFRYLETDVHVTADGVLVAFHDHVLDHTTDRSGRVEELPWREVRHAMVEGREPIARFDELLHAWPEVRINIDAKHDGCIPALADAIRRAAAVDRVCVGSFADKRLRQIRRTLGPALCTSIGPFEVGRVRVAGTPVPSPGIAARLGGACAQVPVRYGRVRIIDRRFVAASHRLGLPVHVWTVDEEAEMERLLDLGVDGIMTDRPALLRAVLERRGEWIEP